MKPSTKHRIAALGIAAVALIAIQSTASGSSSSLSACRTWHPDGIVDGEHQHTLHPQLPLAEAPQHSWNRAGGDRPDHGLHPDRVGEPILHGWNPTAEGETPQHTLNSRSELSEACPAG